MAYWWLVQAVEGKENSARRHALRMEAVRRKIRPHTLHPAGGGGGDRWHVAMRVVKVLEPGDQVLIKITTLATPVQLSLPVPHSLASTPPPLQLCSCGSRFKALPWSRAYRTLHSNAVCADTSCWLSSNDVSSAAKACMPGSSGGQAGGQEGQCSQNQTWEVQDCVAQHCLHTPA